MATCPSWRRVVSSRITPQNWNVSSRRPAVRPEKDIWPTQKWDAKPKTSVPRRRGEVQNKDCVENANLRFELSRVINARIILASVVSQWSGYRDYDRISRPGRAMFNSRNKFGFKKINAIGTKPADYRVLRLLRNLIFISIFDKISY